MRIFILSIILLVCLIVQSTVLSFFEFSGIKPDLILIIVVFNALLQGPREGAIFGFVGGLIQDIIIGQHIGLNALTKMATGYMIGLTEKKVYKENLLIPIFFLILATFINETLAYLLNLVVGLKMAYSAAFQGIIIPVSIYNGVIAPFIYGKFYSSSTKGLLRKDRV